jgi:hypothetical protein
VREPQRDVKRHCIYIATEREGKGRATAIHGNPSNQHLVTPPLPPWSGIYITRIVLTLSSFSGSRKSPFYLVLSKMCVRPGN